MAAFGAVLVFFGIADLQPWILPASGVAGAMVGMVALFLLAGVTASALTFVLSGVILSSIAVAALHCPRSPSPWAAGEIVRWLLGALADRSLDDLLISTPLIAIGAVLILGARRALDALTLGEAGALARHRSRPCAVAVGWRRRPGRRRERRSVGIGFVGLVVPHLLRPLVERSHQRCSSSAVGAALVLAGDVVVRLLPGGSEAQLS